MKLYHFTTFSNFCSIWIQQKLKFSEWTNCNDVFEREKTYNLTLQSKIYKDKDYKDIKGYASPMMWGHYARDYQRSGVCIELDSLKIRPAEKGTKVYKDIVKYKKMLTATHIGGVDAERADAAQTFVIKNRKQLFFQKHLHWKPENEYRCVSKNCEYLDISDAITSVYVLGEDDITLQAVKRIIRDSERISFLNVGGLKSLSLNPMNLYEYEDLKDMINNLNKK